MQKHNPDSSVANFAVDLIHDLQLSKINELDWSDRHTSLYCVVAGNVSSDLDVLRSTLEHLGNNYLGVLYIDGDLEHPDLNQYETTVQSIKKICSDIPNVVYLHRHVVILNNIAFIGINGHVTRKPKNSSEELFLIDECREDDIKYLTHSIEILQNHDQVSQIAIVSASIPTKYLSYGQLQPDTKFDLGPAVTLIADTKKLASTWLFGGYSTEIDTSYKNRRYVNNPSNSDPYWPKRISL